ncbi:MAG: hypothetical protein Q8Q28_05660 [Pseudomonadota bacterium]|nr:hypothetical protein [Pseudomonadota bacterium]
MSKTLHSWLAVFFCASGWALLGFADFYASFKLEVNSAPMGNGIAPTYFEFISSNHKELISILFPVPEHFLFMLVFFIPIAVIYRSNRPAFRLVGLIILFCLAIIDLTILLQFSGGDRKGCEICFLGLLLHFPFSILYLFAYVLGMLAGEERV